jgi:hypothetical protein
LVNVPASLKDSAFFSERIGFVIPGYLEDIFARFCAQDCPTVPHITDVTDLVNNEKNQGATSTFLNRISALSQSQKFSFGILKPFLKSLNGLVGKILIFGDLG